ncbi:DUF6207 family protein [Streptomyces xantholiticus]|uniref:DUF6207 family protein n=1 Tax=Streptomyces xantholiticus TaxID=68285 RepID=A0ABV1UXC1_9ACTN
MGTGAAATLGSRFFHGNEESAITTALAAIEEIGTRWRTSGPSAPWRVPDEPGVRARTYADTRGDADSDDD